jgi:hypothetical protein
MFLLLPVASVMISIAPGVAVRGPSIGPAAVPAVASPDRPLLRFTPAVLDLGEIPADRPRSATVTVTNASDKPITIEGIKAGCGCTKVSAPPTGPVAPGASFTLDLTLEPGKQGGIDLTKVVYLTLGGGTVESMQVKARVKADGHADGPAEQVIMFRLPPAVPGDDRRGAVESEQDAVLVAIDRGLSGSARSGAFRMRLHRESGMLFVHGSSEDIAAVRDSVRALPEPNRVRESPGTPAS